MILEGIVTTLDEAGRVNVSPMGPRVTEAMDLLVLRPYQTSRTYRNLVRHRQGVFHVTDDVELIARAAIGSVEPEVVPARCVDGWRLRDACRAYEFEVTRVDDREDRATLDARVVHMERLRDFFGFHRARHAVLEAAILATRTSILPLDDILRKLAELQVLVDKTGGEKEQRAFSLLREFVAAERQKSMSGSLEQ